MAIQTNESDDVLSEMNVTPLVDVMLVLLVVFIVTAPLLTNSVKVALPRTSATSPVEATPSVTVGIDDEGRVFLGKVETPLPELESAVRAKRAVDPNLAVHLSADQGVRHGVVVKVMGALDRAGVTKLSVLTAPE